MNLRVMSRPAVFSRVNHRPLRRPFL